MKVDVYYNIRKKCLSVRSREKENYGKVIKHEPNVLIRNASFIVQPAGLAKAKKTGVKNVHALVRGTLVEPNNNTNVEWARVRYNPFKWDTFVTKYDKNTYVPITDALYVRIFGNKMFAHGFTVSAPKSRRTPRFTDNAAEICGKMIRNIIADRKMELFSPDVVY